MLTSPSTIVFNNFVLNNLLQSGNLIASLQLYGGTREGAVGFNPVFHNDAWHLMRFQNWQPLVSKLVCQNLGFVGVYATLDGILYTIPADVTSPPYEVECPDDARNITECWFSEYPDATREEAVGIICCEGKHGKLSVSGTYPATAM